MLKQYYELIQLSYVLTYSSLQVIFFELPWFHSDISNQNTSDSKGTQVKVHSLASLFYSTFFDIKQVCIERYHARAPPPAI